MFQKPAMEKHERVCLRNPQRSCWACDFDGNNPTVPIVALITALETGGIPAVRQMAHGCPACILAAILQQRKADPHAERIETLPWDLQVDLSMFEYKKEMDQFCRAVRESRPEDF